jgi:hypothetical protein
VGAVHTFAQVVANFCPDKQKLAWLPLKADHPRP